MHEDEIMKTNRILKGDDAGDDIEISSNGSDESNTEDSMDVDGTQLNGDVYTSLTDGKR